MHYKNLHLGPILTIFEPFIGWVPDMAKSIKMNIKIGHKNTLNIQSAS